MQGPLRFAGRVRAECVRVRLVRRFGSVPGLCPGVRPLPQAQAGAGAWHGTH